LSKESKNKLIERTTRVLNQKVFKCDKRRLIKADLRRKA